MAGGGHCVPASDNRLRAEGGQGPRKFTPPHHRSGRHSAGCTEEDTVEWTGQYGERRGPGASLRCARSWVECGDWWSLSPVSRSQDEKWSGCLSYERQKSSASVVRR